MDVFLDCLILEGSGGRSCVAHTVIQLAALRLRRCARRSSVHFHSSSHHILCCAARCLISATCRTVAMAATSASPDDESEAMYWADAHCHIQDRRLSLSVVRAAEEANVVRIAVCATHPDDWDDVEELWRSNPDLVIPSFGVHPFRVEDAPPDWETALRERLCRIREACVGECGLDRSPNGIKVCGVSHVCPSYRGEIALRTQRSH